MRTYQRLVLVQGGEDLSNTTLPHNFLIYNTKTSTIKIGNTGVRYNNLVAIGNELHPSPYPTEDVTVEPIEETVDENLEPVWPTKKTRSRKKKPEIEANDSESLL